MKAELLSLLHTRRDLWQGHQQSKSLQTLASGFDELDNALAGLWVP